MSYRVLARKWRPQEFSELIGQEPIVTALENALRDDRIAQAYLFSGIRGVGKTTAARLLAKALNGLDDERAGSEILSGGDLDVIEVDAATYSKVEQVRELTESLQYRPAGRRYKVVIIDEIHRLSRQAFDALLKIVEEPPDHLVFIFATTEIEAVPATLLSRCQEFHFRRVPAEILVKHLRRIAEEEAITASDTALRLIARAGEGSVRDSVALLDQLATFGESEISDEDAVRLLGGLDTSLFERLLAAILAGEPAGVTAVVAEIEDHGWDPRNAFGQFLSYCRDALHAAIGADAAHIDLPDDEVERLRQTAQAAGYENLLRLLNQLLQSEQVVRRSESAGLALEIAWLRAAELPKLVQVERLLARGGGATGSGASGSGEKGRSSSRSAGGASKTARSAAAGSPSAGDGQTSVDRPAGEPTRAASEPRRSRAVGSTGGRKTAATRHDPKKNEPKKNEPKKREPQKDEPQKNDKDDPRELEQVDVSEVEGHPVVQAVLDVFGGSIDKVESSTPKER